MNIAKEKLSVFFILIFSLQFATKAIGQDLHQTFAFANELIETEQYERALLTFHRVLFFGEGSYQEEIFHHMGTCYYELKEYENAARYYDLAYFAEENDSIKIELTFKKTSSLLMNKDYAYAQIELFNLPDNLSPYFEQKRNFYEGITYFGLGDYLESENKFLQALPVGYAEEKKKIMEIFKNLEKVEKISPKKARILSMFIPGLGQVYAGDWRNGLNSFLLNAGFAVLAVQTAFQYSIWDVALSILPWYQRYHMGGYMGAERIAYEKIERERGIIYSGILEVIAATKIE